MGCCVCAGSCNHVGPHAYCAAHGGNNYGLFPTTTVTTQTLVEDGEVERLRQLVKTKDEIIAALRRQLERSEDWARELMRML